MQKPTRKLSFVGSSKDDISAFPKAARLHIGHTLNEIVSGVPLADLHEVKSFLTVGPGAIEITTHTGQQGVDHRTFLIAKFPDAVYVLHAFEKRQQRTPPKEIAVAKSRLSQVMQARKQALADAKRGGRK